MMAKSCKQMEKDDFAGVGSDDDNEIDDDNEVEEDIENSSLSNVAILCDNEIQSDNLPVYDLTTFYSALNFVYTDFTNELSLLNPCLISGDSLLLEIICYKHLNWHWGGQTLPIIYLVEQLLYTIQNHGGSTKIVWFKELENLFAETSEINLIYQVVKKHCQAHLDSFETDSPVCNEWSQFLCDTQPPFIIVSSENVPIEKFYDITISKKFKAGLVCIIYSALKNGVSVATVAGLHKSLSVIEGFYAKSLPKVSSDFDNFVLQLWEINVQAKKFSSSEKKIYTTFDQFWSDVLIKVRKSDFKNSEAFEKLSQIFLFYLVVLKQMPLNVRYCSVEPSDDPFIIWIGNVFVPALLKALSDIITYADLQFCTADFYDGKLFFAICCNFDKFNLTSTFAAGSSCFNDFQQLCERVGVQPFVTAAENSEKEKGEEKKEKLQEKLTESEVAATFVPKIFSENQLIKLYYGESIQYFDPAISSIVSAFPRDSFFEKYHWHSGKLLQEDLQNKHQSNVPSWKLDRQNQRLRTWYQFYGESLEGLETLYSLANHISSVENAPCNDTPAESKKTKKQWEPKEKGAKKAEKQSRHSIEMAKTIRNEKREKDLANEKKEFEKCMPKQTASSNSIDDNLSAFNKLLARAKFDETKAIILKEEVRFLIQDLGSRTFKSKKSKQQSAFRLIENIKILTKNYGALLVDKDHTFINEIFQGLGFSIFLFPTTTAANLLSTSIKQNLLLSIDFFDYQLKFCGQMFEIQANPQPDRRIRFIPDLWQVKLLDVVDSWQSALIVAPTSAGKTFISYYCIEKVFRETTDGIVVYVSPTKALVNQVAATIYARCKKLSVKPGQAVFGVFTRDYRHDVLNSRVLITIPQCLEILLLSPMHCEWRKKIQYVIFDEIHCISGGIGGSEIWEHIILMVQCPFLALSATVANPDCLLNWLTSAEEFKLLKDQKNNNLRKAGSKSYTVQLITFKERFSELEMFLYNHGKHSLESLHPFSTLHLGSIIKHGFPSDMQLTALQVYSLFDAMFKQDNTVETPVNFFNSKLIWLKREDLRNYETVLKTRFVSWVKKDIKKAEAVIRCLAGDSEESNFMNRTSTSFPPSQLVENIVDLILQLKHKKMLPTLVFSDNRSLCEVLAHTVSDHFALEEEKFLSLPENQAKLSQYEKDLQNYEKQQKKVLEKADSKRSTGKSPLLLVPDAGALEMVSHPPSYPFKNLSKFLLRSPTSNTAIFDKVIKRYISKAGNTKSAHCFLEWLKRGIGVHHSGLTTVQRQSVEILFRAGLLNVVFSTSTLALGINMPCRSVVFCYDSIYITPLQYRQMSGRAGRRGFDKKGDIVFYGIPPQKITKLVCSNLPAIKGNVPFGVSFILRLFILTNKIESNKLSVDGLIDQCLVCLQNPLYAKNMDSEEKDNFLKQLRYYVVFCIQILRLLNLIDDYGCPIGMAGIVSHLHYHEPGNFIFVYFLQCGLFHNLCKKYRGDELLEQMLIVLCTIFTHEELPCGWANGRKFSNSKVILEPLPENFCKAIVEYNDKVEALFAKTVADSYKNQLNKDNVKLPVSNINVNHSESVESVKIKKVLNSFASSIQNPIAAISGINDNKISFLNNHFFSSLDQKLYFDQFVLPSKPYPIRDHRGEVVSLNAYALDFFRHGIRTALCRDNNLFEGDVYNLLKDFLLIISAISTALNYLADLKDPVVVAFAKLDQKYKSVFSKSYGYSNF